MNSFNFIDGEVLLINKPLNWTSFDVVNKIRYAIKRKLNIRKIKVGHAGTLDPLATGLLVLCTGKKTKTIDQIQATEKEYTGTITLGANTPSYDLETEITETFPFNHLSEKEIVNQAKKMTGEQLQKAPIFSAKRINGEKAYIAARKGEEVKMKESLVNVKSFEITNINLPNFDFKIQCSKGTYIRSIAFDFGKELNVGGHLSALQRTKVGEYSIEKALTVEQYLALIDN